jgi:hypothetical protein
MILMSIGFVNFRIVQIYLFWIIFQNDYLNLSGILQIQEPQPRGV